MAETGIVARSPIAPSAPEIVVEGWAVSGRRSRAALTITDCTPLTKVTLKAPAIGASAERMGVPFGRAARQTWAPDDRDLSVLVAGLGPSEWLVLARPGVRASISARLSAVAAEDADQLVTAVDLSHGRALIRLTGARSADLLAKETPMDLSDAVCPDGVAFRSVLAGLAADVVRDDRDGARSYLVGCERSSGQYVFDSLLDAGAEFGIEVDGFVPPGM